MRVVERALLSVIILLAGSAGVSRAQPPPSPPPPTELIMLTGSETATYYRVGRDLRRLLDEKGADLGIDLAVVPSQGALQNVIDVFRHPAIQLGLTQTDILAYLEIYGHDDPEARRMLGGLEVVSPLYDEDVYLFANPDIQDIGDLGGKRVSIGAPGSGVSVSALVLLHLAGVEPRELATLGVQESMTALRQGRIDAMFYVIGTPSALLTDLVPVNSRTSLVPIRLRPREEEVPIARYYPPSTIPAKTYPWLDHAVETVHVRSVLISAGTPAGSPECEAIGRLVRFAGENLDWLRRYGHRMWKDVRPDRQALLEDPRLSPCVRGALRQ